MQEELSQPSPQSIVFEEAKETIIQNEIYKNPKELFAFAETITRRTLKIADSLGGNNTALEFGTILKQVENPEEVFQSIIDYGKIIGIVSKVQTDGASYQAIVILATHLRRIGLGFKKMSKPL